MRTIILSIFFVLSSTLLQSQSNYFQQDVDYTIEVALNDSLHVLSGNITIDYTNNSPDELDFIYFHLWPNAYKSKETAFAKQQLRMGSDRFYFAKKRNLGHIDGLNFLVNGEKAAFELDEKNPDIGILHLNAPLKNGQKIKISTDFKVKIPASYSRLGHVRQSYQITQWYPKPAVYDQNGWHQMPYLDMGEFYSEFGSFDVKITLPENYVVGASGDLQTENEKAFLQEKTRETNAYFDTLSTPKEKFVREKFPVSSKRLKTIHFTAENVHDFAWFADKRFKVRKSEVKLASGKSVDTWVMFTKTNEKYWEKAVDYVNRSVLFYSEQVGEYPYPHATAIQSALSAGGGMEYPMITVIGRTGSAKSLDEVITHEVGHNWFYGILGSNERDHAWMDEGFNSFYEHRYMTKYYGDAEDLGILPDFLSKGSEMGLFEVAYLYFARKNISQACETSSDDFYAPNYLIGAYLKPPMILRYLENYIGLESFDKIMHDYYDQWKFKHPQPQDFQKNVENAVGKPLNWMFDGLLYSDKKMDYALTGIAEKDGNYQLTVKNAGEIAGPFSVSGKKDSTVVFTKWYEAIEGKSTIDFPKGAYDLIVLDEPRLIPDLYRKNNNIRPKGIFKKVEPLQFKLAPSMESDKRNTVYTLPAPAWNLYDGFMLGAAFYNTTIPARKLEFHVIPMYGFKSKSLAGIGSIQYHFHPKKIFKDISLGLSARRFHFNTNEKLSYDLAYNKLKPFVDFKFKTKPGGRVEQHLKLSATLLSNEAAVFDTSGMYTGNEVVASDYIRLVYAYKNRRVINPFDFSIGLEQAQYDYFLKPRRHVKAWAELNSSYTYARKKSIDVRLFVGGFLKNPEKTSFPPYPDAFNLSTQGGHDYRFDDYYFARNEGEGFWSHQINSREGGLKYAIGEGQSLGRSGSFIAAINLRADLPQKLPGNIPLKPYFDLGYYHEDGLTSFKNNIVWNAGVLLDFFGERVEVYFPIVSSKNLGDRLAERGNFFKQISFKIDLNSVNPWEILEDSLLGGN